MVWPVGVELTGRLGVPLSTACPNWRRVPTAANANASGESIGVIGLLVASGPNPTEASAPRTNPPMVAGAMASGRAAEMAWLTMAPVGAGGVVSVKACCWSGVRVAGAMVDTGTAATGALATFCTFTRSGGACCDASTLLIGLLTTATGGAALACPTALPLLVGCVADGDGAVGSPCCTGDVGGAGAASA